ncbi:MAG: anti-sigma factor family protein [Terriglobia bacterium]
MNWDCAQLDERLSDYLEGRLRGEERTALEAHAHACHRCAEWVDARLATAWLRKLEPVETPPGLETRILAQTLAPPPQESFWAVLEAGWRALAQPRFSFSLAAALLSVGLVLNALDVSVTDVRAADLNPVNIYRTVNRNAHLAYAHGVRFLNDLRVVYEIRSRLEELAPETEEPPASTPPDNPPPPDGKGKRKQQDLSNGGGNYSLLAFHNLAIPGELR